MNDQHTGDGTAKNGLYLVHLSLHGLIRGDHIELGRDADTGGQVKYVVELARALGQHPDVAQVDLFTRKVDDRRVSDDYARELENIGEGARIVRLPCGPRRYLRKESLWPHLQAFVDASLQYFRRQKRVPDLIHGHYADAGWVAAQLGRLLEVPVVFTGHSLGRVKLQRMVEQGQDAKRISERYQFPYRIEAEESALETADFVIASTRQEVEEQYRIYEQYVPERMEVIPPGIDLGRFAPPKDDDPLPPIAAAVDRFLSDPDKPLVFTVARPDERKNLPALVKAFGRNEWLCQNANLLLILGNREDLRKLPRPSQRVLYEVMLQVDLYDLYGSVAYPKQHAVEEVPDLYRLAARRGGVFVNPALTEPFGLTLIEAAASGLPMVATNDGGPRDIIRNCDNGLLVDPLDVKAIGDALESALRDRERWQQWAHNGLEGVHRHYSWSPHVEAYLQRYQKTISIHPEDYAGVEFLPARGKGRLATADRMLISDIDYTLTGDDEALAEFAERIRGERHALFGVATGRHFESAMEAVEECNLPRPDVAITSVGTEIRYGPKLGRDRAWAKHIDFQWHRERILDCMELFQSLGLELQPPENQLPHKISYLLPEELPPELNPKRMQAHLRRCGLRCKLIMSHDAYLDIIPIRASKGLAVRWLAFRWGLPADRILVAGDSGNDEEMLAGHTLGIVVGNYSPELERLRGRDRIYFADGHHAAGINEGIDFYDFFGSIRVPEAVLE
ncbi:MAG: HAD-IIB family hydrolase [Planctomycetota bacterium]